MLHVMCCVVATAKLVVITSYTFTCFIRLSFNVVIIVPIISRTYQIVSCSPHDTSQYTIPLQVKTQTQEQIAAQAQQICLFHEQIIFYEFKCM